MPHVRRLLAVVAAVGLLTCAPAQARPADAPPLPAPRATAGPIHAIFYYPWYPQTWYPGQHFHPSAGLYSSGDRGKIAADVAVLKWAGMDAAIASWWGPGHQHEDTRFPRLFRAAQRAGGFAFAPYYEPAGQIPTPTVDRLRHDLSYLGRYAAAYPRGFLHVDGKPVVFVYNSVGASCRDTVNWSRATDGFRRWYVSLKVFPGYLDCPVQPSTWHQYGPADAWQDTSPFATDVSPGFFKYDEATPRLVRDPARFCRDLTRQAMTRARWKLVTSFNEWGEGTAVESAVEWATANGAGRYLTLMHRVFVRGKRC